MQHVSFRHLAVGAALAAVMGLATPAVASPISGLYSTGVDDAGVVRTTNIGLVDLHYATTTAGFTFKDARWGYPWLANTATAGWIAPFYNSNGAWSYAVGTYVVKTSFSIAAGEDPATAAFSLKVAADNSVSNILLNGHSIGNALGGLNVFNTVATSHYFVSGLNTLEFDVVNAPGGGGNPAGLIVDVVSSTVSRLPPPPVPAPIPEPDSWALLLAGLGLVGAVARKRVQA